MYQITWKLLAFFSFVLPILAATISVRREVGEVEKRANIGKGTFYYPGLGSCGQYNTSSQLVVALSVLIMNKATDCGTMINITSNGTSAVAGIFDTCQACGPNDLDMSPTLFQKFAPLSQGVTTVSWYKLS